MAVLIKPLVTEKLSELNEQGRFAFLVDRDANKVEIKRAIEQMYGVTVESVNTMIAASKPKNRYTKGAVVNGRTKTYKKAIVKVADGEFIDFYSGV